MSEVTYAYKMIASSPVWVLSFVPVQLGHVHVHLTSSILHSDCSLVCYYVVPVFNLNLCTMKRKILPNLMQLI